MNIVMMLVSSVLKMLLRSMFSLETVRFFRNHASACVPPPGMYAVPNRARYA